MKKSTSAVLAVSVLVLALGGAYFFASGDQLQGRFTNLNVKPFDQPEAKPDFKTLGEGTIFESGGLELEVDDYFVLNSFINSSAELDLDSDEEVIVGHLVMDFTQEFLDMHSGELVNIDFGTPLIMHEDDGVVIRAESFFDNDLGINATSTSSYTGFWDGELVDVDPSEGSLTLEFWVNSGSGQPGVYSSIDLDEDYFLAWDDVYVRTDSSTYAFFGNERSGNDNNRFTISDLYNDGSEDYMMSLMTFTF